LGAGAVTFGDAWTALLVDGASAMRVDPAWVLAVCALESGFDPLARNRSGAFGLFQRMPPYSQPDPRSQLRDYFDFCDAQQRSFHFVGFRSREELYCCNLAPARLAFGNAAPGTILYSAQENGASYRANAEAFGLNPNDPSGAIRMRDLAFGLDAAIVRCRERYDEELSAAIKAAPFTSP
jgi:hypothetical protein